MTFFLELIGFAASGVLPGSIAAGIQSTIGNVAAGSIFATCQSMAATGAVGTVAVGTVATVGAVVAAPVIYYGAGPAMNLALTYWYGTAETPSKSYVVSNDNADLD